MGRVLFRIGLFITLVAVSVFAAIDLYVEPQLIKQLEDKVKENCPKCSLKIAELELSFIHPGDVSIGDMHFTAGDPEATQVVAHTQWVTLHLSLHSLMDHHVRVRNLLIDGFDVTVFDGDKHSAPTTAKSETLEPVDVYVGPSKFIHGFFKYIRNHEGTTATVHVHEIDGGLSTIDPKSDRPIQGYLTAQYENTGIAKLEVTTNPFKKPIQAEVKLTVKDQDLNDLTLFFKPNAGVELKGKIIHGVGEVSVNGDKLKATDWIIYDGLYAKVDKGSDRSGFVAFFENMGMDLSMQLKNVGLEKEDQTKTVELSQQANESLISFILRGLKEASMKVATRSNK